MTYLLVLYLYMGAPVICHTPEPLDHAACVQLGDDLKAESPDVIDFYKCDPQ